MATVLFGEFGCKNHERSVFNPQEKALLMQSVSDATEKFLFDAISAFDKLSVAPDTAFISKTFSRTLKTLRSLFLPPNSPNNTVAMLFS